MSDLQPEAGGRFHPYDRSGMDSGGQNTENNRGHMELGVPIEHESMDGDNYNKSEREQDPQPNSITDGNAREHGTHNPY